MTTPKRRTTKAFLREEGEFFTPVRSRYSLADRFVFEAMSERMIACPLFRRAALDIFHAGIDAQRLDHDGAKQLLADALAYTRTDLSQRDVLRWVETTLRAVLDHSETVQTVPPRVRTGRDAVRLARKAAVRTGRRYRGASSQTMR